VLGKSSVASRTPAFPGIQSSSLKHLIPQIMTRGLGLDLSGLSVLAGIAILGLMSPVAAGWLDQQTPQPQQPNFPREFDAVSIKPYTPKGVLSEACGSHGDPKMLREVGCTVQQLVTLAYNLKDYQVRVKGPAWVETDPYVIEARIAAPASETEMSQMLQHVLAARFSLTTHREMRLGLVYLLQTSKRGLKLPKASREDHCGNVTVRENFLKADCLSLDDLADALQEFVIKDGPVINRTGIDKRSRYALNLNFTMNDEATGAPTIFVALPEQLGLTLNASKGQVETLVIDRAQRPQPN